MTKYELNTVIGRLPGDSEIVLVLEGIEYRIAEVECEYSGFCDPQHTIRLIAKP